jgi:hypothetical protein
VPYAAIVVFADVLVAFLEQPFHSGAGLGFGRRIEMFEGLLETGDVLFGFAEVILERSLQLVVGRFLDEFRDSFRQPFLGVVDVFKLLDEQRAK